MGSRRSKRTEDVKENDGTLDVDDLEGIFTVIYSASSSDPYKDFILSHTYFLRTGPKEDLTGIKFEDDDKELELQMALKKAHRLKELQISDVKNVIENVKQESTASDENQSTNIVLNATAEFCRTLGDIPTYGLAGNREENGQELMVHRSLPLSLDLFLYQNYISYVLFP